MGLATSMCTHGAAAEATTSAPRRTGVRSVARSPDVLDVARLASIRGPEDTVVPNKPLQQDEVIAFVSASPSRSCAVVHVASKREVKLFADAKTTWMIQSMLTNPPDEQLLRAVGSLRVKHTPREMHIVFGPQRGKVIVLHLLRGRFRTLASAASASLALARLLAGVPDAERLWVTSAEYDDRGEPPQAPAPSPGDRA